MLLYCVLWQNWAGLWRREVGYCCYVAVPIPKLLQMVYSVTQYAPPLPLQNALLGTFAKLRLANISFVLSVCPSVRMEQLGSYWTNFHEI